MEDLKNTREMTLVAEAYTRYRTLLVAYANKRTRNLADAEDVVQEAFIKIINMGDMVYAATIRNLAFYRKLPFPGPDICRRPARLPHRR